MMITKKFKVSTQFDFSKLIEDLQMLGSSADARIEEGNYYKLVIAEKYFYRSSGAASVTLLFIEEANV